MAVSHLSVGLLVCLCIYMSPSLSATPGESQIKHYSSVFYLYAPIRSALAGSWILLMRTGQPILVHFIAHRVMCSLNSSLLCYNQPEYKLGNILFINVMSKK